MLDLISGQTTVNASENTVNIEASLTLADGIEAYRNTIPESSYTQETTQSLSVPVTLQVIQNGQVVFESTDKTSLPTARKLTISPLISTGKIDTAQDYEIVWKAAVLDRVTVLAQDTISGEGQDTPGTEDPGTDDPALPAQRILMSIIRQTAIHPEQQTADRMVRLLTMPKPAILLTQPEH